MSIFFDEILVLKKLTLQTTSTSKKNNEILHFDFDGLFANAEQLVNKDITISRIVFPFSYYNSKRLTKNVVTNLINKFNSKIPFIKITLKKNDTKEVQVNFSMEYTIEDNLFKSIDLNRDIDLLISSTIIFQDMLSGKSNLLDE
ncbi:hypothetical protein ACG95N_09530 [Acinetobacter guillouiae]|uniref:hypothetical protein n=1 Tax=Acinetobacter guillouiae TaxID=106649 RepID=UPI003AF9A614